MRIAIDARAYSWAGIGRYIRNILAQLATLSHNHEFVVVLGERDANQYDGPFMKVVVDGSYYSWREQLIGWRQMQAVRADVWHFTHFNVPWFFNRPYVVTVHDVTRFIFPGQKRQNLRQQLAYEALFARAVRRARHLILVSHATADALRTLPIVAQAAESVIYEGVEEKFFLPVPALQKTKIHMLLGSDAPYLLYVGVWMSHKNLERLLHAYAVVRKNHPALRLVMTGRPVPGYTNMIEMARRLHLEESVLFPGYVSDDLLPALYAGAQSFIFPSLYEGFGLPALEAAACGVPVVTSNVASTQELLGGAAQFVNPESVASIVEGIEAVIDDGARWKFLQTAGRARAAAFRWDQAAREHLAV